MSSGARNTRNNKGSKGGGVRTSTSQSGSHNQAMKSDHNHNEKDSKIVQKIAPTAEQLRIAHMIENTNTTEQVLQEKITQVTQVTGVSTDDAIIALHDCNNDVNAAIDALLEGDDQGEWKESTKKKKKPATKTKDECESNKENRRLDNRDKHSSKPRGGGSRQRGTGRGGRSSKDETSEGSGRGRKPSRMVNGSAGSYRGRGQRGRGSGGYRTFQNRQPSGFTETIDTWGPVPDTVNSNSAANLQIDTWDQEPAVGGDDWDEWTGSLDTTTVFGPSSSGLVTGSSDSPNNAHSVPGLANNLAGSHTQTGTSQDILDNHGSLARDSSTALEDNISAHGGMNQRLASPNASKSYGSAVSNTPSAMNQSHDLDFASLLQKAAPHSTLGRLPPSVDNNQLQSTSTSQNLMAAMANNVDDSLKSGYTSVGSNMSPPSKTYSSSPGSNNIYQNSALSGSVSSDLRTSLGSNKGLMTQSVATSRGKSVSARRIGQPPSKIPATAVEMPENTMTALELQFSGLEFGTESFEFGDVKSLPNNNLTGNVMTQRDGNVQKDITSLPSLPQQQSLVPEPIPFPTQNADRKSANGNLLTSQRAAPSSSSGNYSDIKKENSGSLGALVGSSQAPTSLYQPSGSYTSKTSSSFPSPPSAHFAQNNTQNYSSNSSSGVGGSSYSGSANNKAANNSANSGNSNSAGAYSSSFASHGSAQYQNNFANSSSHSSLASINVPQNLTTLKDSTQSMQSYEAPASSSTMSGGLSTSASGVASSASGTLNSTSNAGPSKPSGLGKNGNVVASIPPGVSHLPNQTPLIPHQMGQAHHQLHQQIAQSPQNQQMMTGPSQYVPPTAALQGSLPTFYNVQQPAMYSYEDLQMFQQRIPHMPQPPTTLPRDGSITTPAAYSATDAGKFRSDQNSSPVPSTMNQQGQPGATYITATGNAAMPPFYMYHNMVPSNFPQYGHPTIIQLPPNSHTGTSSTQFPGPPKLQYGGTSNYAYDNMSQSQDYKSGYGSSSQGQSKTGANSSTGGGNANSDLGGYKNHLNKVGRTYEKPGYHSGTPPPYNLAGSAGSNPMTNAYGPAMFFSTVPATAQHHSPLMHHQLHQDGGSANNQRSGVGSNQNKGSSKGYSGSYWGN